MKKNMHLDKINFKSQMLTILLYIFTFLFLIFPTSYGIVDLKIVIIFFPLLLFTIYLLRKIKINEKYYPWIIIILAILTRVGVVLLLNSQIIQVSDFAKALEASYTLKFEGDYYQVFTHWILYPTILNFIYKIFGESQLVALLVNAIILVFVSLFVYKVASLIFNKKSSGFLAAIIYTLWPVNILYTIIFTQEHLCTLLLLIVLYLFLKNESKDEFNSKKCISLIIIGILLGISTFLKNFAPVFLIAFIIYYILKVFNVKKIKNYTIFKILSIFIIFISYSLSKNVIFNCIDNLVGTDVARNIIACYLNVGLRDDGTYSSENYGTYFSTLKENNYDYEKTNSIILKDIIKDSSSNLSINFFSNKASILFGGDYARLQWISNTLNVDMGNKLIVIIDKLNNCYFTFLVVLMILGLIYMNRNKDLKVFLLYLIFFGSFLLLLLVEAQNRYMYAIQFIMCILSVLGINYLVEFIDNKKVKGEVNNEISTISKNKTLD